MLYIIATPIGNLEDITLRALRTLKEVDYIACEDTRRAGILLKKYDISGALLSYHAHSSRAKENKILDLLEKGNKVALISDAGTPGISDPGYRIISQAIENNISVVPLPGPSAFLTALQASGLPVNRFQYLGFLPVKKGRQTLFLEIQKASITTVFYESSHRIIKTLLEMEKIFEPERKLVVARELTKLHEEFVRGSIKSVVETFNSKKPKGEFVVIIPPLRK